jgi:NitT/TauT family transport system substrate-binding protein
MITRTCFSVLVGTLAFVGLIVAPTLAQAPPDAVTVAAVNSVADSAFLIADRKGFFRDAGISVKFVTFDSGAAMIAPLGTGQIDVAGGAPAAGLYNALAMGINIKIVAERASDPPGYGFNVVVVRKDLVTSGRYKKLSDLKGLKFAEPGKGSTSLSMTEKVLEKGGLKYDDVEHVFLGFPAQVAALQNGSIDVTGLLEPWATQAIKMGLAVRIMGGDDVYPNQQLAVTLYSGKFAQERPDVARRFMVAYVRALRYYADALKAGHLAGPNATDVIGILADVTKLPTDTLREMVASGVNPSGHINEASLLEDYAAFRKAGLVQSEVDVNRLIDMSFVDNANAVLGPYKPARR